MITKEIEVDKGTLACVAASMFVRLFIVAVAVSLESINLGRQSTSILMVTRSQSISASSTPRSRAKLYITC